MADTGRYVGLMAHLNKLCKVGRLDEAFQVVDHMCQQGMTISRETVYSLLQGCCKRKDLLVIRRVHSLMVNSNLDSEALLGDHLIRLFTTCRSLQEANLVFDKVAVPSVYTWHAIISAHATLGEMDRAFELYNRMISEGTKPDKYVFSCILKTCSSTGALAHGKLIHDQIIQSGLGSDVIIGSTLVDMYAKCGCLEKAFEVFENMPIRDRVTWNSMIAAYVYHGHGQSALELFEKMQQGGIEPDKITFLSLLKACSVIGALGYGKIFHDQVVRSGLGSDMVVGSTLIDMYAKCGRLDEARKVFGSLLNPNVVAWSAMIAGYAQHGHGLLALTLFEKMQQEGIKPDKVTFTSILKACSTIGSIGQGKLLHEQVIKSGIESDVIVGNCLFDMYAKYGSLEEARKVFDGMPKRDAVSWGTMIAGYAQHNQGLSALDLYEKMQQEGNLPDEVTYSSILKACGSVGAIGQGKLIHERFFGGCELDLIVGNTLIDMYAKCGNLKEARKVFDDLTNPNVVSWNVMITGYAQHGQGFFAFELFRTMQQKGIKPTKVTYLGILKACGSIGAIQDGELIHAQIIEGAIVSDMAIGNTIIDMYAKCGRLEAAHKVFNGLPNRDVVSWGAIIGGYVQNGYGLAALDLFKRMQEEGMKPDKVTILCVLKACASVGAIGQGKVLHDRMMESGHELDVLVGNALVNMYAKCGSMEVARGLFDELPNRDLVSWNAMIAGYTLHGYGLHALELFEDMQQQGRKPDRITYLCTLKACSSLGGIQQGKLVYDKVIENGFGSDVEIGNTLVDMYARCGSLTEAQKVFDKLPSRDVVSWGVMIAGYAHHGKCSLARQCLEDMLQKGLKADSPIYISILAAYSHAGLVEEGYQYFSSMREDLALTENMKRFNCLIDLLGRAGRLKEAEELLQTMPSLPRVPAWVSLLTACRSYGNVELGRKCFNYIAWLDPTNAAGYALMSGIYADAQMWDNVQEIEELKTFSCAWKTPGKACIEVDEKAHDFSVGDNTHLDSVYVYAKVTRLRGQIKGEGYVPQLGFC